MIYFYKFLLIMAGGWFMKYETHLRCTKYKNKAGTYTVAFDATGLALCAATWFF